MATHFREAGGERLWGGERIRERKDKERLNDNIKFQMAI